MRAILMARSILTAATLTTAVSGCSSSEKESGAEGSGGATGSRGTLGSGGATGSGGAAGSGRATGGESTTTTGGASNTRETGSASLGRGGKSGTGGVTGVASKPTGGAAIGTGGRTSTPSGIGGSETRTSGTLTNGGTAAGGTTGIGGAGGKGSDGVGGGSTAGGSAAQICPGGKAAPTGGNRRATLQHGGRSRSYILHVPAGLSVGTPLPLVFDLHGASGSGSSQQSQSGWDSIADRAGFLMIYPDGIDGYWNVDDTCCGTAGSQKIDDVGFLKEIIGQLSNELCVDARRIYVTGFSNGGGLAHRIGCDAANVIAAIAPIATDLRTKPCNATRPISMMEFRGTADSLEPYEGGLVGPAGGQYLAVGAKASLKLWADINQCTGTTTTIDKYCESYTTCKDGVEADLCSLPGVDHAPYRNNLNFNVADTAWKMFQRQPMP